VFNDNGKRKARRHVWDNHPIDVLNKSQNNVFKTKEEAEIYIVKTSYEIAK
jgi:Ser/Thr protein kinase RdoA (MazF antagonist)